MRSRHHKISAIEQPGERRPPGGAARLAGAFATLALLALGTADFTMPAAAQAASSALGVDCARVSDLGIDRQLNMRAGLILSLCGLAPGGQPGAAGPGRMPPRASPPTNVDVITGVETFPSVTQSESMVWSSDGNTIVVNYNDSNTAPANYSGVSVSTDGGATFTRLLPAPFATGHGTNFGDPNVVYNAILNTWFAGDLATGCGGFGIGLWTSPDGTTWTPGACAHSGNNDDRNSMWVDNNPASPFPGRMYVSWNDFNVGGLWPGALFVTYSDDGVNWSAPVQITAEFIRNVQLTGSPTDGTVFVAAMDEGGGGLNKRANLIFRSLDGGNTWTGVYLPPFAPPGDSLCDNAYFAKITPIWRHQGWGQPGVGPNGIVHYAYAGKGVNPGDTGDIYYIRSADNGLTWSSPIVLNSDSAAGGNKAQWMPSLSVTAAGEVQVAWYDRRDTTDGTNYEYFGIHSPDNGVTWLPDAPISDVLIPQPEQPDLNVQRCYAGDYNYHSAFGSTQYATWTDGRVPVSGHFQQDVFFAHSPF